MRTEDINANNAILLALNSLRASAANEPHDHCRGNWYYNTHTDEFYLLAVVAPNAMTLVSLDGHRWGQAPIPVRDANRLNEVEWMKIAGGGGFRFVCGRPDED